MYQIDWFYFLINCYYKKLLNWFIKDLFIINKYKNNIRLAWDPFNSESIQKAHILNTFLITGIKFPKLLLRGQKLHKNLIPSYLYIQIQFRISVTTPKNNVSSSLLVTIKPSENGIFRGSNVSMFTNASKKYNYSAGVWDLAFSKGGKLFYSCHNNYLVN